MTEEEVRIVRRRLEDYPDWISLARRYERKSAELKEKRIALQTPKGISYEPHIGGNSRPKDSIVTEYISDEQDADEMAVRYKQKAHGVKCFIGIVGDDQARAYMERAYLHGERYWDIGQSEGYSKMAVCRIISRGIASVTAEDAYVCGLL